MGCSLYLISVSRSVFKMWSVFCFGFVFGCGDPEGLSSEYSEDQRCADVVRDRPENGEFHIDSVRFYSEEISADVIAALGKFVPNATLQVGENRVTLMGTAMGGNGPESYQYEFNFPQ